MTATQQRTAPAGRRSRARRRRSRTPFTHGIVGLALACGAIWVQSMAPSPEDMSAPLTYVGDKDDEVATGRFTVRVESVESARSIGTGEATVTTDQMFLILQVAATSAREPLKLPPPSLLTEEGLRFHATNKVQSMLTLSNKWVQPGMWSKGVFVFEVPPSVIAGARAVFPAPTSALYGDPVIPEAEIDLGIDDAQAKQLVSAPKDVYPLGDKR
ncbi:hypothetical protein [Thermoactinospora rubra]|uniref:hypothetical protein n=1 Tax=Thermoactinospora rubra TaxID=1088767 RepID=UPI000A0F8E2B|nr:hypothetical protein [Thermoactinospora rubra]